MGGLTILALYELEKRGREVVAELRESLAQLATVDGAGVVAVKVPEDVLPVLR